jgi:hypothetical protein
MSIPYPSHVPPKHNNQPPKADLRREITAWQLLVWTYADERVRAASGSEAPDHVASNGYSLMRLGETGVSAGTVRGLLEPHEDALAVDALVWAWFDHDFQRRAALAAACERRKPLPQAAQLKPFRFLPKYKDNGKLWMEYRHGEHGPYCCVLDCEGYTQAQLQRVQDLHDLFVGLLDVMIGMRLSRYKVVTRGLTV